MLRYLIGHRGASGYEPENTLLSFKRAFDDDANAIEMDLRLSADGEIVIIHDRTVDRTTDGSGPAEDQDLETLLTLDAGKGERIPTFGEALRLATERGGSIFAEVKVPGLEETMLSEMRELDALDRVIVFGLPGAVARVHKIAPSVMCTSPGSVRIGLPDISPEEVSRMHAENLVLVHGDIDQEEEMARLIELGLDGIITNFPCRLSRADRSMMGEQERRKG
jgi:glycerophosphoryl diester phosphodiesterase